MSSLYFQGWKRLASVDCGEKRQARNTWGRLHGDSGWLAKWTAPRIGHTIYFAVTSYGNQLMYAVLRAHEIAPAISLGMLHQRLWNLHKLFAVSVVQTTAGQTVGHLLHEKPLVAPTTCTWMWAIATIRGCERLLQHTEHGQLIELGEGLSTFPWKTGALQFGVVSANRYKADSKSSFSILHVGEKGK